MRASPRKRSPDAGAVRAAARGTFTGLALLVACAGLTAGTALAGSSVEAHTLALAQLASARSETRAQALNLVAGVSTPRLMPVPAKAAVPAKVVVPAKAVAPARIVATTKVATMTKVVPAKAAVPAKAGRPAVRAPRGGSSPVAPPVRNQVAAVAASMRPTMNPVPPPSAAHLDDQVTYQYNALGRRDPFMPLVGGAEYVPIDAPLDIGAMQVVGIVWGAQDKFAIIEDGRGNSMVLRPGDKVMNGVVEGLKRDGVIVSLTTDGQTQSVTIPLTRKGESNANR